MIKEINLSLFFKVKFETRKEENILFMPHSTHLWLYGITHVVKDHSDSERRNLLLPLHVLLILISSKGYFTCTIRQTG